LDRAQRDGHFHALLESPTGTGKSLSLLCSVIAWQKNHKAKLTALLYGGKADPEAMADVFGRGGGFVPEAEPSGIIELGELRTHSQISQVIGEFRKTNYHVPMAVLIGYLRCTMDHYKKLCYLVGVVVKGSRKRYCTNADVRGQDNIDEKCKLLIKVSDRKNIRCKEFLNAPMIRAHPSVRKGGCYEAHDIEDLVKVREMVRGHMYFYLALTICFEKDSD
ncbi:fanconi anemia group J protein, partial [Tanacetum coccineum]